MKKHGSNVKFALVCAEDVLGQQMRAELRKHGKSEIFKRFFELDISSLVRCCRGLAGMAAHARHGTWLLTDNDATSKDESAERSIAAAQAVRPHIVHMNGRSFLPPEIKQKVEARFRQMQQQDGEAQQLSVLDEANPLGAGPRHDERERLREALRTELGLE